MRCGTPRLHPDAERCAGEMEIKSERARRRGAGSGGGWRTERRCEVPHWGFHCPPASQTDRFPLLEAERGRWRRTRSRGGPRAGAGPQGSPRAPRGASPGRSSCCNRGLLCIIIFNVCIITSKPRTSLLGVGRPHLSTTLPLEGDRGQGIWEGDGDSCGHDGCLQVRRREEGLESNKSRTLHFPPPFFEGL